MHCPTTVISARPIAVPGMLEKPATLLEIAFAAIAAVPKVAVRLCHQQLTQLKHAVFKPCWHADAQNVFNGSPPKFRPKQAVDENYVALSTQKDCDQNSACGTGEQRCGGSTCHAHAENEDQQRVSADVDDVDQQRYKHGNTAVSHRAEQRSAGIVNGQKRVGYCAQPEIGFSVAHNLRFDIAKDQLQEHFIENQDQDHNGGGERCGGI